MSKLKSAELDESALFITEKLLAHIETFIDHNDLNAMGNVKILKKLIQSYNQLKPYSW